ncbi:MAG: anti-sigma factor family protein [Planctomycetota bacterium]|jgi:hypothetical protein
MLDQFDEAELLSLIEGELDPEKAEALEERLAAEPGALALIERMRDDRVLMRSLGEVELPTDLMAELEPLMARPMLMPPPSELRRRRRRRGPRRVVIAAAVAAPLLVVGVWAAMTGVRWPGERGAVPVSGLTDDETLPSGPLAGEAGEPSGGAPGEGAVAEAWPPPGREIHHRAPLALAAAGSEVGPGPDESTAPRPDVTQLAAGFVLIVETEDSTRAEEALRRVVSGLGPRAALVRNFSEQEAERLAEEWRLSMPQRLEEEGLAASAGSEAIDEKPDLRVRPERGQEATLNGIRKRSGDGTASGRQLWGPSELAPSLEQQLAFSGHGAAYTIAVPVSQVAGILARLRLAEGQTTSLQTLRPALWAGPGVPEAEGDYWLGAYPAVRAAADRLRADAPHAVVLLPVVVEERGQPSAIRD